MSSKFEQVLQEATDRHELNTLTHQLPQQCVKEVVMYLRNRIQRDGLLKELHEVEQILGKELGYPWYKDDQKNFPGSTAIDGVCVGEHTVVTLAMEAAAKLKELRTKISLVRGTACPLTYL